MRNVGLDEAQMENQDFQGEVSITSDIQITHPNGRK